MVKPIFQNNTNVAMNLLTYASNAKQNTDFTKRISKSANMHLQKNVPRFPEAALSFCHSA